MYRIVAYNPDGSSYTIYDPVGSGALPVRTPRTTEELNEAGSLELTLLYGHSAYGHLMPKKTYVSVELDGNEYFYGRMLNGEPSPLTGQTQCTFAGALSFLQDTELPPDPKKEDGTTEGQTLTAEEFFVRCLNNHNSDVGDDSRRKLYPGIVDHSCSDVERVYQISSYTETLSAMKQNLLDRYGGFFRVRKSNGVHYLDWVEQYGETNASTVSLGQNILTITNRMNADGLVTAIRPVGKDNLTLSGDGILDIFPDGEMAGYGRIIKSVSFPDAETEPDLLEEALALIEGIHKTIYISSDINLLDIHFVDGVQHPVNLGDVFTNIAGLSGTSMTVSTRSRDMESPQNDSISLKNPKSFEGDKSGGDASSSGMGSSANSTASITQQAAQSSAARASAFKHIKETEDRLEMTAKEIYIAAEQLEIHADMFVETANEFARLSHKEETLEGKMGIIEGTGVIQNSEHITQIAGKFQYDPENNVLELINGSELKVHDRSGVSITVGTRLTELGQKTAAFEGSALWTQRDNITGIVGEFEVKTVGGVRTLVVKSGGGLKIARDNVEYGVYDNGSLTAGVIVDKINGGTARIRAEHVYIGDEQSTTVIAGKLDANNLTADLIQAKIEALATLNAANITANTIRAGVNFVLPNGLYLSPNGVWQVQLSQSGNTYTLTEMKLNGDTREIGTFSKAIASASWAWSNGAPVVTLSPQGQSFTGDAVDGVYKRGDPSWASDYKSVRQNVRIDSEGGTTIKNDYIDINTTAAHNAGWNGCYNSRSVSAPASGSLGYSGSASVVVKLTNSNGIQVTLLSRTYTSPSDRYETGREVGYKEGWNDCVDAINANKYWFTCYTGTVTTKYDAPTGGAASRRVIYPYESANHYRYNVPAKK